MIAAPGSTGLEPPAYISAEDKERLQLHSETLHGSGAVILQGELQYQSTLRNREHVRATGSVQRAGD